jgi:multicomponent Na+:H+ antiporter subunit E
VQAIKGKLILIALLFAVWLGLAHPVDLQELLAAVGVAVIVGLLPIGNAGVFAEIRMHPRALIAALAYGAVFVAELIKANLDVARRVLSPGLPIRPGIVRVHCSLESGVGRLLLANSITLTPGTITVETKGSDFYIHWIDVQAADAEEASRRIVRKFERHLEVFCG